MSAAASAPKRPAGGVYSRVSTANLRGHVLHQLPWIARGWDIKNIHAARSLGMMFLLLASHVSHSPTRVASVRSMTRAGPYSIISYESSAHVGRELCFLRM